MNNLWVIFPTQSYKTETKNKMVLPKVRYKNKNFVQKTCGPLEVMKKS